MKWWAQQDLNLRPTPKAFRAALTAEPPVKQWAQRDLKPRPSDYESPALTTELWAHDPNSSDTIDSAEAIGKSKAERSAFCSLFRRDLLRDHTVNRHILFVDDGRSPASCCFCT